MITTRLVTLDDAEALSALLVANREYLAPWEPIRGEHFATVAGQFDFITDQLKRHAEGMTLPQVIVDDDRVVGRIILSGIVHGFFQSCAVGYWVDAASAGRGVATAALRDVVRIAFEDLGLHRMQAETLPHNVASQKVLDRVGFERFGMAPKYLKIAGEWQDMFMFQLINNAAE